MAFTPPFAQLTPQQLAQLAQAAFRPAPLMQAGAGPGLNMPQAEAPAFSMKDGFDALSRGLAAWKPEAQSNGMSILSPSQTGAAYRASSNDYTRPGLPPTSLGGGLQPPSPAAPVPMPTAMAGGAPDFLSGAPAGYTPEEWSLLQRLRLTGGATDA
jgi:hypothetical protein